MMQSGVTRRRDDKMTRGWRVERGARREVTQQLADDSKWVNMEGRRMRILPRGLVYECEYRLLINE